MGRTTTRKRLETTKKADGILGELHAQVARSGLSNADAEFMEFIWGMTIIDQMIERQFKRFVASEFGLASGDVRILLALRRAGPKHALRPTDLFRSLLVTSGAITKQVDRLAARGLVRRSFNSKSKRGWLIVLTSEGLKIANRALDHLDAMPLAYRGFRSLTKPQRADLLNALQLMVDQMHLHNADSPID